MSDRKLGEKSLSEQIEVEQIALPKSRFTEAVREARAAHASESDAPLASQIEVSVIDREMAQLDMLSGKLQLAKQLEKLLASYDPDKE